MSHYRLGLFTFGIEKLNSNFVLTLMETVGAQTLKGGSENSKTKQRKAHTACSYHSRGQFLTF